MIGQIPPDCKSYSIFSWSGGTKKVVTWALSPGESYLEYRVVQKPEKAYNVALLNFMGDGAEVSFHDDASSTSKRGASAKIGLSAGPVKGGASAAFSKNNGKKNEVNQTGKAKGDFVR